MWLYTKQFDWEKMWAIADDITDEAAIRAKAQDILDTFDIEGGERGKRQPSGLSAESGSDPNESTETSGECAPSTSSDD